MGLGCILQGQTQESHGHCRSGSHGHRRYLPSKTHSGLASVMGDFSIYDRDPNCHLSISATPISLLTLLSAPWKPGDSVEDLPLGQRPSALCRGHAFISPPGILPLKGSLFYKFHPLTQDNIMFLKELVCSTWLVWLSG